MKQCAKMREGKLSNYLGRVSLLFIFAKARGPSYVTKKFRYLKWRNPEPYKLERAILGLVFPLQAVDGRNHAPLEMIEMIENHVNKGINYQPELVSLPDFWLPSTVPYLKCWVFCSQLLGVCRW